MTKMTTECFYVYGAPNIHFIKTIAPERKIIFNMADELRESFGEGWLSTSLILDFDLLDYCILLFSIFNKKILRGS